MRLATRIDHDRHTPRGACLPCDPNEWFGFGHPHHALNVAEAVTGIRCAFADEPAPCVPAPRIPLEAVGARR